MLNTIIPFIILILVVVFIHEYGHYYFARKYGVGVTDFSIGFGKEENNLLKLAKELNIENEVIFLKNINENLKLALIQESNLFLMPTRIEKKSVEGFGISFIEAASLGVGSIGGKDGGAPDAIEHKKTGLICDGSDLNSIYDSVMNFFNNNNYEIYGKNAKKFSENFYWENTIKKYLKLLN